MTRALTLSNFLHTHDKPHVCRSWLSPARVTKINLSTEPPSKVTTIAVPGANNILSGVLYGNYSIWGTDENPCRVAKINNGNMTWAGTLTLPTGLNMCRSATILGKFAYFG